MLLKRSVISVLLVLIGVFVLSLTAQYSKERAISSLQQRTQADLNRYILTMRQKLARFRDIPQLLSTHPDLIRALRAQANSNDYIRANLRLEQVNKVLGTRDSYLMDAKGVTVAASNWESPKSFIGKNFSFRPYFRKAMQGEIGQYFALGTTSKKRGYYYSYPLRFQQSIIGVVVVKIDLNEIEQDWNEPNIELIVSDEDGVIFISTHEDWKFRTLSSLQELELNRIEASRRYIGQDLVALNITHREKSLANAQIITLKEQGLGKSEQRYLVQNAVVGNSDLNVSIFADLETAQRQVLANMLFVGTVYVALVLLIMVILARRRFSKQKAQFEQRELQALEESEARVKAIIHSTRAGLITLDTAGFVESMNVTAQEMFHFAEGELKGVSFASLLEGVDQQLYAQQLNKRRSDGSDVLIEGLFLCKNQHKLPVEFVIGKMQQQDSLHFLVTLQDITERKEYEAQLDQSNKLLETRVEKRTMELTLANERLLDEIDQHSHTQNELIQTAKLAVIGQMSTGINHELNQPLMAIRGYADNARSFLALDKTQKADANLDEIAKLTERMAKILHPLKEFSRKSSGAQQLVPITALRSGVLAILYPKLEKTKVVVDWQIPASSIHVLGDLLRLEQVMVNLITNAIQALELQEEFQRPEEQVTNNDNSTARVLIKQRQIGENTVEIQVIDTGHGIDEQNLDKVFEPFYTTKQEGQGLGLGLSISKRIIEDLGGNLTVQNHAEDQSIQGAQFTLSLPKGD